jgi:hypothetical protein
MKLDHLITIIVGLGIVAYIFHRVAKKRKEIRQTIQILGAKERPFAEDLLAAKVKKFSPARA